MRSSAMYHGPAHLLACKAPLPRKARLGVAMGSETTASAGLSAEAAPSRVALYCLGPVPGARAGTDGGGAGPTNTPQPAVAAAPLGAKDHAG